MGKKKKAFDFPLFLIILVLLCMGLNMVFSASAHEDFYLYNDSFYHLKRQLLWSVFGIIAMVVASMFDYRKLANKGFIKLSMFASLSLLIIVLLLPAKKGVHRWIGVGGLSIQPSEIAKLVLILYVADYLTRKGDKVKEISKVIHVLLVACIFSGLILIEPNMSTSVIAATVSIAMLFIAGAQFKHLFLIFITGFSGAVYLMLSEPYRLRRFTGFLDPFKDPLETGYQAIQSLYALGSGGIFGVGLSNSRQKKFYIPEAQNDFIFSIIGEELGLIGTCFIIVLFALLVWRGFKIALNCKNKFGSLLASGITMLIAVQSSINLLVVSSFMPVTGVTLPLISYGGSSLVLTMLSLGILLSISRHID